MQSPAPTHLPIVEFELICDADPNFVWAVCGVDLDEGINQRYRARVELECEDEDVCVAEFLGCSCELVFMRETESRRLFGVIVEAEHLSECHGLTHVRLTLVPVLTLLDQGSNSRIFQDQSVRDIVVAVLEPALAAFERDVRLEGLTRGAEARDYCVQYQESDCAFVVRLLAEEGISYCFEHHEGDGAETLVLRDSNDPYPAYEGFDGSREVPVIPDRAGEADLESIQQLITRGALTLTNTLRRDFDWLNPRELLTAAASGAGAQRGVRRCYVHGQRRFIRDDQAERAADRLEAESFEALIVHGRSNVTAFAPGLRFHVAHPNNPGLDGEYLLTRVVHRARSAHVDGDGPNYENEFECVPVATPARPPAASRGPRVLGPQTATVVGDEDIFTDEHGRVQVQLHWEESPSYASGASCWVRCAQAWAGPGFGAQFIPRVGMEVVVEFLEGNPDRPLVTGCVYNGDNTLPFVTPDDKTRSGWRTHSVPGGEGYNMLCFEDAAGREEIHIHGQKDWTVVIENDKREEIRHDQSLDVANDRNHHVGHDETASIDHNQSITVGHDHTLLVGACASEVVTATKSVTVGADHALSVGGGSVVSIAGGSVELVGTNKTVVVDGGSTEVVAKARSLTAKQLDEDIEDDKTTKVGKTLRMSAGNDFTLEAQANGLVDAGDKLVLGCGKAAITLKKNGDIKIEGNKIEIKGKGAIKIKGNKVASN